MIISDPRFKLLPLAQKREIFQEYSETRVEFERAERRAKEEKAKVPVVWVCHAMWVQQ
jgi:hypothetical protein